jgi:hypothetical protein
MKTKYFLTLMRLQILQSIPPRSQDGAVEVRVAELTCGMITALGGGRHVTCFQSFTLVDHGRVDG